MQMGTRRVARGANSADDLPLGDNISLADLDGIKVGIKSRKAVSMIDHNVITPAGAVTSSGNHTAFGCIGGCPQNEFIII